jgi:hypothetical protein
MVLEILLQSGEPGDFLEHRLERIPGLQALSEGDRRLAQEIAFGVLRKMFNLAEVWGYRPDGTNPCRHVPMYPPGEETRLIVDDDADSTLTRTPIPRASGQ